MTVELNEEKPKRHDSLLLIVLAASLMTSAFLVVVTMVDNAVLRGMHQEDTKQVARLVKENRILRDEHNALPTMVNNALGNLGNQLRYQTARAQNAEARVEKLRAQCISKGVLVP